MVCASEGCAAEVKESPAAYLPHLRIFVGIQYRLLIFFLRVFILMTIFSFYTL